MGNLCGFKIYRWFMKGKSKASASYPSQTEGKAKTGSKEAPKMNGSVATERCEDKEEEARCEGKEAEEALHEGEEAEEISEGKEEEALYQGKEEEARSENKEEEALHEGEEAEEISESKEEEALHEGEEEEALSESKEGEALHEGEEEEARSEGKEGEALYEGEEEEARSEGKEEQVLHEGEENEARSEGREEEAFYKGKEDEARSEGKEEESSEGEEEEAFYKGKEEEARSERKEEAFYEENEEKAQSKGKEEEVLYEGTEEEARSEGKEEDAPYEGKEEEARSEGKEVEALYEGKEEEMQQKGLNEINLKIEQYPQGLCSDFAKKVLNRKVALEDVFIRGRKVLLLIAISCDEHHPKVSVRYTTDSWETEVEGEATEFDSNENNNRLLQRFFFTVDVPEERSLQFAVKSTGGSGLCWDNNDGANYRVDGIKESQGLGGLHLKFTPLKKAMFSDLVSRKSVVLKSYSMSDRRATLAIATKESCIEHPVVRYTLDDWKTSTDLKSIEQKWKEGEENMSEVQFDVPKESKMNFAIFWKHDGMEYWDNNDGKNFEIQS